MAWSKKYRHPGGSGGKRGHSNMSHWEPTEHVKEASRKARRNEDKDVVAEEREEAQGTEHSTTDFHQDNDSLASRPATHRRRKRPRRQPVERPPRGMAEETLNELLEVLRRERYKFHYAKDQYAFQLLSYALAGETSLQAIRRGPFASLLQKPAVRESLLSSAGTGMLTRDMVFASWPAPTECYLLTFSGWGAGQVSRSGKNLVVQLNFSSNHDRAYRRLVRPEAGRRPFAYALHPVSNARNTLAWVRIDLADDLSHALIEEVQCDWLRIARRIRQIDQEDGAGDDSGTVALRGASTSRHRLRVYTQKVLRPHTLIWAEAALSAALEVLVEEIGVRRIFYHTWRSGNVLKGIASGHGPPKSLYKRLPRSFAFVETAEAPPLLGNLVETEDLHFFLLEFPPSR